MEALGNPSWLLGSSSTVRFPHGALLHVAASAASLWPVIREDAHAVLVTAECELYRNAVILQRRSFLSQFRVHVVGGIDMIPYPSPLSQRLTCQINSPLSQVLRYPNHYTNSGSKILSGFYRLRSPKSYYLNEAGASFLPMTVKMNYLPTRKWQHNYKICYKRWPVKGQEAMERRVMGTKEHTDSSRHTMHCLRPKVNM